MLALREHRTAPRCGPDLRRAMDEPSPIARPGSLDPLETDARTTLVPRRGRPTAWRKTTIGPASIPLAIVPGLNDASRLALLRRIAAREGELDGRLACELYRSEQRVDFVARNRDIDCGGRPRSAPPLHGHVLRRQVRRNRAGIRCGVGIAIDHHVANGGLG